MLGACTSHIYCHHLIPHKAEEALPLRRWLKLILTMLSRNSATELRALPPSRAGAQVGDTVSTEASEEEDLFAAALSVRHPQGCRAGGYRGPRAATATVGEGQRGHTTPCEATPGSGSPAWEGGRCPRGAPGPGKRGPPGPWGEAALRQLALWPGSEQHRPLGSSLRRAEHKSLPPTGYCYQPATATETALQEETLSHYLTGERRSRNPSLTKPSRQIQRLTH